MPCFHLDGLSHVPGADQEPVQLSSEDPGTGQVAGRVQGQDSYAEEQAGGQARRVLFIVVLSLILRYVNGYTTFLQAFGCGFLLWTIVNLWDAVVLDMIWFCHDPHFVFKGTEDMVSDYHDYWFHIKGFFIGEVLALVVCALAGLVVQYILYIQ